MTASIETDPATGEAHVELDSVRLAFGRRVVFRDLRCRAPRGRVTIVLGGSGSGKSTLLRLVGGLQRPDAGSVRVAGEEVTGLGERELTRVRRKIGMLFQNGALLDSISIFENVALPLREHTAKDELEIESEVHRRLASVGLDDVDELLPGELSGGMLRRAALARAIVMDPEILLCDEPFSGLDPPNVERIEALLTRLNRELGLTIIVTSHHMASSMRMGDQLVLLRDGFAVGGTPAELVAGGDPRVVEFLGSDAVAAAAGAGAGSVGS
ncbi:MAG: ATP-binding cassette domain-containing protein [Proteobacteria bacterium]|nr:ATP-binding cassette domain-containing protein [Pseudomonadota bacterium]